MKRLILSVIFTIVTCSLTGQPPKTLSRQQALDDLASLYSWIREIHPDMFAYCPKKTFEREWRTVRRSLPDSLSTLEFARSAIPLVTMLGDGHTSLSSPGVQIKLSDKLFPFQAKIREDSSVYVVNDFRETDDSVPAGTRILRINGKDIRDIVGEMMRYVSGEQSFFRIEQLNKNFIPALLKFYSFGPYRIEYEAGKDTLSREMSISAERYLQAAKELPSGTVPAPYTFRILPENIGLMEYNQCHDEERFGRFVDSVFSVIRSRGIDELVIDVRKNGGGNSDCSNRLLSYISPVPFRQFGKMTVRVSDALKRIGAAEYWIEQKNGYYPVEFRDLIALRDSSERFRGSCHLLTSHNTFSSAADFAWAFQHFGAGDVIGQETGGLVVCFGDIQPFSLPNSGLRGSVSYKKFWGYGAKDSDTHGVIPDHEVPADEALDYTLKNLVGK